MSGLAIETDGGRTAFRPGQPVAGVVRWSLAHAPRELTLQLLWTTRGKGNVDTQVVDSLRLEHTAATGTHPFRLRLAEAPFSCSGRLVSVLWALRLKAETSGAEAQLNITMSPNGQEIDLVPPREQ